jgi:putative SOS response-associated peptidase YedK
MCGRFALYKEPRKLAEDFNLTGELDFSPSWSIAPSTRICTITADAIALMETIHDRMPVILDRDQWAIWLSPHEHRADQLLPIIRPHDAETMQVWPVSREVNRVGLRDDAGLLERVG